MKLTNQEIRDAVGALQVFMRQPVPVGVAFTCAHNIKALGAVHQTIEETRDGLIKRHAKKDEEGNAISKDVNGQRVTEIADPDAFNAEHKELMEQEVEVSVKTVSLARFSHDFTMQPGVMVALAFMFTEPHEAQPGATLN